MTVYNLDETPHRELGSQDTGERFSVTLSLADLFGFRNVRAFHDLPRRRNWSWCCRHPRLALGEETALLRLGDFVGFKPGERPLHVIEKPIHRRGPDPRDRLQSPGRPTGLRLTGTRFSVYVY